MVEILKLVSITLLMAISHGKRNVLFIMVDDLRPQLDSWMGPDFPASVSPPMITPNIDDLASRSLQFTRAYCQYPLCNPSRTSMMTGRRPDTTKVYNLRDHWRDVGGNFTSMPQYFKENGYTTVGISKIYHEQERTQDPISWSEEIYFPPYNDWFSRNISWISVDSSTEELRPLPDDQSTNYALETMERLAADAISGNKPFFLAVGLFKPHLPFSCPSQYFDLYPTDEINLPNFRYVTENMPHIAESEFQEFRQYQDIRLNFNGEFNETLDEQLTLELRRAYYSCVSYIDFLIGELIRKIDQLELSNNTIITFAGDHGFQLGENAHWVKENNFELSNHVPMMIHIPGLTDDGIKTDAFAELVDFYPTLAEAAGLEIPPLCPESSSDITVCSEGWSLMPLVHNTSNGKIAAFMQSESQKNNTYMGYTVRTDGYRYTEWPRYDRTSEDPQDWAIDWNDIQGYELYDHTIDPEEHNNCVNDIEYDSVKTQLSSLLRNGWRTVIPIS